MELIHQTQQIIEDEKVIKYQSPFIEANTSKVTLNHLMNDCTVPVFSKDNEVTISHSQFIQKTVNSVNNLFGEFKVSEPDIRVSHVIKGRIPTAIGKPVKELLEHERTIYYERCAFVIHIPEITHYVNGNNLSLLVGGVRAYNQENLYSKKSPEKFKMFIGFKNQVCTNLCVNTDGLSTDIRAVSLEHLEEALMVLCQNYNYEKHIDSLVKMSQFSISEKQFAHLIGKARMYQYLSKGEQENVFPLVMSDRQINKVVKGYYNCSNFKKSNDGSINLWKLYNLFTEANKSSYIDAYLEKGLFATEFIQELHNSIESRVPNWYLHN
jgi:hypothetical protein